MKINSNTIKLEDADYKNLESVIEKIAAENKIENVDAIQIKLSADEGIVIFKTGYESIQLDKYPSRAEEEAGWLDEAERKQERDEKKQYKEEDKLRKQNEEEERLEQLAREKGKDAPLSAFIPRRRFVKKN